MPSCRIPSLILAFAFAAAPFAGAQTSSQPPSLALAFVKTDSVLVDGKAVGAAEPWGDAPVGHYKVVIATPDGSLPGEINLTQKAGKLAAEIMTADGDGQFHPLEASVSGNNLMLKLNRPKAPIAMTLQKHGARLSGTWAIDAQTGRIEGELQ